MIFPTAPLTLDAQEPHVRPRTGNAADTSSDEIAEPDGPQVRVQQDLAYQLCRHLWCGQPCMRVGGLDGSPQDAGTPVQHLPGTSGHSQGGPEVAPKVAGHSG